MKNFFKYKKGWYEKARSKYYRERIRKWKFFSKNIKKGFLKFESGNYKLSKSPRRFFNEIIEDMYENNHEEAFWCCRRLFLKSNKFCFFYK